LFAAVSDDDRWIVNHFVCTWQYILDRLEDE